MARRLRNWTVRSFIGAALGVLIVLGWIRREAYIATTPAAVVATEELKNARTKEQPTPTNSPSQREGEKPKEPSLATRQLETHQLIPVPFVSQAPFRVWDLPYKEFCEEASVLTLHYWKQGMKPPSADQIDRDLKGIQAWETVNLRTWDDTTAEETAQVLRKKFGHTDTRVVRNVTIEDIIRELDAGHPVIVPAAGRELSSPYYRTPGPLYHMLVIIGYDEAKREFITNDVGTNTKGAGFRFTYDDLYGAMGDWDVARKEPDTAQKVMIVVE